MLSVFPLCPHADTGIHMFGACIAVSGYILESECVYLCERILEVGKKNVEKAVLRVLNMYVINMYMLIIITTLACMNHIHI